MGINKVYKHYSFNVLQMCCLLNLLVNENHVRVQSVTHLMHGAKVVDPEQFRQPFKG